MLARFVFGCLFLLLLSDTGKAASHQHPVFNSSSLEGRWDISVDINGKISPSWLEVRHSGSHTLVGDWVSTGGSARPIAKITYEGEKFHFAIPPQWEQGTNELVVEGQLDGNDLTGTVTYPDGKQYNWKGVRAPLLKREKPPVWGKPIQLFNGHDLSGWHASGTTNQWQASNGILSSPKSGSNIVTDGTFNDFQLHIEFRYPAGSNSGVYLRGRYEVQITDSKQRDIAVGDLGAVYGFLTPSEGAAKEPGAWQSYDITLVGRMVTVVLNGKTIICNREIPGITGGALNSNEGEPGPFYLQGDHGPIEYRNIVVRPAK